MNVFVELAQKERCYVAHFGGVFFWPSGTAAQLDGYFTADELREIADAMDCADRREADA